MSTRTFEPDDKSRRYHTEARESVDAVLQRLCDAIEAKPEMGGFARALDISPDTIKTWRRRGRVPLRYLQGFSAQHGVSLDWLLHGGEPPPTDGHAYGPAADGAIVVTTDGSATVYRIASPGQAAAARPDAAWLEVLTLVLDELSSAGRRLPGAKVIQLVDLLMQLQQAGARLEPELLRSQLRLIA